MPKFNLGDTVWFMSDGELTWFKVGTIIQTPKGTYYAEELEFTEDGPRWLDDIGWSYWCTEKAALATHEEAEADLERMEASHD